MMSRLRFSGCTRSHELCTSQGRGASVRTVRESSAPGTPPGATGGELLTNLVLLVEPPGAVAQEVCMLRIEG
jgi:hypothetical protein